MMNDHDDRHNGDENSPEAIELTPSEKAALETLPHDRMPRAALEDRVVEALRERGVLVPARGRVIELTPGRLVVAVAASLLLLAGGFGLGQWTGGRRAGGDEFVVPELSDVSVAATLQRAGSEYVMALERFAELPDSADGNQAIQGREVALTTLYTAADQVTRLVPKNELARQLLLAIDAHPDSRAAGAGGDADSNGTRVIEF